MVSRELRELLGPGARIQTIIWFAFVATVPIYVLVAHMINRYGFAVQPPNDGLTPVFYVVAAFLAAGSFVVRRLALTDEKLKAHLGKDPTLSTHASGARVGQVDRERRRRFEALPAHEQRLTGLLAHLQIITIVTLGMQEAIVVLGLVLAILQQRAGGIYPFAGLALLLMILSFPRPLAMVERAAGMVHRR